MIGGTSGTANMFGQLLTKAIGRQKTPINNLARWCKVTPEQLRSWMAGEAVPRAEPLKMLRARFPVLRSLQVTDDPSSAPTLTEEQAMALATKHEREVQMEIQVTPLPPRPPHEFGPALRWHRLQDGLATPDLAELVEISEAAIRAWEAGRSVPVRANLDKLETIFPALAIAIRTGAVLAPPSQELPIPVGKSNVVSIVPAARPPEPANDVAAAGAMYAAALRDLELARLDVGRAEEAISAAVAAADEARGRVASAELAAQEAQDAMARAVSASITASIRSHK